MPENSRQRALRPHRSRLTSTKSSQLHFHLFHVRFQVQFMYSYSTYISCGLVSPPPILVEFLLLAIKHWFPLTCQVLNNFYLLPSPKHKDRFLLAKNKKRLFPKTPNFEVAICEHNKRTKLGLPEIETQTCGSISNFNK